MDELIVNEFDKSDYSDGNLVTRQATFNGLAKRGGGGVVLLHSEFSVYCIL